MDLHEKQNPLDVPSLVGLYSSVSIHPSVFSPSILSVAVVKCGLFLRLLGNWDGFPRYCHSIPVLPPQLVKAGEVPGAPGSPGSMAGSLLKAAKDF